MIFEYKGSYDTFVAQKNKKYVFDLFGAKGYSGGMGGHVQALYQADTDTTMYIYVGGEGQQPNGGWNGGGNGGLGYTGDGQIRSGGGGGGATDIRVGGTSLTNRILVAGGGGGNGGGSGGSYPKGNTNGRDPVVDFNDSGILCAGGLRATLVAGGAGGATPSLTGTIDSENDNSYYVDGGGGGGGGYYGGGGGSTGNVNGKRGTSYTGSSGSAGSQGQGGNGGSKTTSMSGWSSYPSAGGGGGSSFISTTTPQIIQGIYDQDSNGDGHGRATVYEVISAPKIVDIYKDGKRIVIKLSKEVTEGNEDVEEIFYYRTVLDIPNSDVVEKIVKSPSSSTTLSSSNVYTSISFNIPDNLSTGYHTFYFTASSADDKLAHISLRFLWNDKAPSLTFNYDTLDKTLIQGRYIANTLTATGLLNGDTPLIYETKLIIDGQEYGNIQRSENNTSIFLPCLYDGINSLSYTLKLKSRVGQVANGEYGIGKEIWSDWYESKELTVHAPIIPLNKISFKNVYSDKAVEKDTKITVAWGVDEASQFTMSRCEYVLSLFKGDKLIFEKNCGQSTETDIVMSFQQGDDYRFGISIVENGSFISEINFSDTFHIANINTNGKISLSENLTLVTAVQDQFTKIEILINNDMFISSTSNVNKQIPVWILKNGSNSVVIKVYTNEVIYVKHTYNVFLHVIKENITSSNTHTFNVSISVNDENSYTSVPQTKDPYIIDLGVSESEFESAIETKIVDEINQKITIKKIGDTTHDLKILDVIGGLG